MKRRRLMLGAKGFENLLDLNIERQEDAIEAWDLARARGEVANEPFESRRRGAGRKAGRGCFEN
ncbi:MAG: hypothetical protein LC729_00555 [Acidobacteria bacterium]|nr:hypothetical protein [Acidobacteriota bacterium]